MVNFVSKLQRCMFFLLLSIWMPPLILFSFYFPPKITSWGRCGRTSQVVSETLKKGGGPPFMRSTKQVEKWTPSRSCSWAALGCVCGDSWPKAIQQGCQKKVKKVTQTNQNTWLEDNCERCGSDKLCTMFQPCQAVHKTQLLLSF